MVKSSAHGARCVCAALVDLAMLVAARSEIEPGFMMWNMTPSFLPVERPSNATSIATVKYYKHTHFLGKRMEKEQGKKITHFSIPTSEMFRVLLQSFDLLFSLCVSFFIGHPTIKALLGQRFLVGQHRGQFLLGRFTVGAQIQHSFLQIWAGLALELLICGFLHLVKSDLEILGEIMTMK